MPGCRRSQYDKIHDVQESKEAANVPIAFNRLCLSSGVSSDAFHRYDILLFSGAKASAYTMHVSQMLPDHSPSIQKQYTKQCKGSPTFPPISHSRSTRIPVQLIAPPSRARHFLRPSRGQCWQSVITVIRLARVPGPGGAATRCDSSVNWERGRTRPRTNASQGPSCHQRLAGCKGHRSEAMRQNKTPSSGLFSSATFCYGAKTFC